MNLPLIAVIAALILAVAFIVWRRFIQDTRKKFPTKPHQADAIALIWYTAYGVKRRWWWPSRHRPPTVEWMEGAKLDYASHAWTISWDPDGGGPQPSETMTVAGLAHAESNYVQVAWPAETTRFTQTALAHELWHCYLHLTKGDGNPEHTDAGFQPGGAVDKADALLKNLGL